MQQVLTAWAPHTPCPNLPSIPATRLRWAAIQPLRQTVISILNTSYNPASFQLLGRPSDQTFRRKPAPSDRRRSRGVARRIRSAGGKRGLFLLLDAGSDGGGEGRLTRRR